MADLGAVRLGAEQLRHRVVVVVQAVERVDPIDPVLRQQFTPQFIDIDGLAIEI